MTKIKMKRVMEVGHFFCGYYGEHMCSVDDAEFYYDQDNVKLDTVLGYVWRFFPMSYMDVDAEIVTRNPDEISISDEDEAWDQLLPWLCPVYTYCYKNAIYKFLALVRLVYGKNSNVFKDLCEKAEDLYDIDSKAHKNYLKNACEILLFQEICDSERKTSLVKKYFSEKEISNDKMD